MRKFIDGQVRISRAFDRLWPEKYQTQGWCHFNEVFIFRHLGKDARVYDIGGGKNPCLSLETKQALNLTIVGLDIDQGELDRAPAGVYDETVCADVTRYRGQYEADIVICQTLLEHVRNQDRAFAAIASTLKPGGKALVFVPSRNAAFARLNMLLPESLKRWLLYAAFPAARATQGFPAYYDRCTPRDFRRLAAKYGLEVVEERYYYTSAYFWCFFPVHFFWRLWMVAFSALAGEQAAETFSLALRKRQARAASVELREPAPARRA